MSDSTIILKIIGSFFVFVYLLLGMLWPVNDRPTGFIWKSSHVMAFIAAMYLMWA